MKKSLFLLAMLVMSFGFFISCDNDDDTLISYNKLPVAAQEFVQSYFDESKVINVFYDKDYSDREYKVIFADGSTISFDRSGEWEEIYMPFGIKDALIPIKILDFVDARHPNARIVQIDRDRRDIEIELSNGLDLIFDLNYNFVRYDD
ncbi:MAG: PepSY-like domain-containing protein [Tannerellaceae bacterium]